MNKLAVHTVLKHISEYCKNKSEQEKNDTSFLSAIQVPIYTNPSDARVCITYDKLIKLLYKIAYYALHW